MSRAPLLLALSLLGVLAPRAAGQGTAAPTVGDTVVIARPVQLPAGAVARPLPFPPRDAIDLLGAPRVAAAEGRSVVEYPLVFWRPGDHTVELPGVVVIRADGRADTLPPYRATVTIASVLPTRARNDTTPAPVPQPAIPIVPRTTASPLPLAVLLLAVVLLLVPLHLWWRRSGPPALPVEIDADPAEGRLPRWVEQGETRAAIEQWLARLTPVAGEADDAPPEATELRAALAAVRYAPPDPEAEAALCHRAEAWWSRLTIRAGDGGGAA